MRNIFVYASAVALVLGSCAKEMAETVTPVPSVEGNSTVLVSFNTGDETTRTHLGDYQQISNAKPYSWDEADAIGAFANEVGDVTNATFKYLGMKEVDGTIRAEFKGSFEFINSDDYIVYYPYAQTVYGNKANSVVPKSSSDDTPSVFMYIPETQLFNFEENDNQSGEYAGSFAQNTAPAIGIGTVKGKDTEKYLEVSMVGAASYIFFPIKGTGSIKTLKLTISQDGKNFNLNGYNQVIADPKAENFGFAAPMANGKDTTTLNCGVKGVELDRETATNFWFVVPNLKLNKATITFTVNNDKTLVFGRDSFTNVTTQNPNGFLPNKTYRIFDLDAAGKANTPWYIDVPAEDEDDFIIDNEYKFLEYAYAATVGKNIPKNMKDETSGDLKAAKIVTNLDFSDFTFAAEGSVFRKAVATWYNEAEGVIPTIGGANAFTIKGAKADVAAVADAETETPAAITITGLKVNGALFNDAAGKSYTNAVKNIVLVNLEVAGSEYILANRVYKGDGTITISDVTVKSCKAPEGAAVIGRAFTNTLADNTITNETDYVFANELNIMEDYNLADLPEGFKYNGVIVNRSTNAGAPANGKIVTVADAEAAAAFIKDVANTKPSLANQKADWYSVKDANGTFYYTGTAATALRADKYITAEEFAYYINNTDDENVYELTHSIDMMGEEVEAMAKKATVTVAKDADVTISNVVVKSAYLLAKTGTAEGVNVEADYSKAKAVDGYVGGLFHNATATVAATTTGAVKATATPADATFGSFYGYIDMPLNGNAAELTLAGDFTENVAEGAYAPYGSIICTAAVDLAVNGYTNITFTGDNVDLDAIANHIKWNWTSEHPIPKDYHLVLLNKGNNVKVTFEFKINNDETLAKAIEDAVSSDNKTVEIPAGVFGAPDLTQAAGVAIVGATDDEGNPATVFDGAFANTEGVEISNVKFTYTDAPNYGSESYSRGVVDGALKGKYTNCVFEGASALYQCTVSDDLTFTGCTFTATEEPDSWALQFNSGAGKATFIDCTIKGWFGLGALDKGYEFKGCTFTVSGNRCGGNLYCDTVFDDCKFIGFPAKAAPGKKFQWIALNNKTTAFTTEFAHCDFDGTEITEMYQLFGLVVFYNEYLKDNKLVINGTTTNVPIIDYYENAYTK